MKPLERYYKSVLLLDFKYLSVSTTITLDDWIAHWRKANDKHHPPSPGDTSVITKPG